MILEFGKLSGDITTIDFTSKTYTASIWIACRKHPVAYIMSRDKKTVEKVRETHSKLFSRYFGV